MFSPCHSVAVERSAESSVDGWLWVLRSASSPQNDVLGGSSVVEPAETTVFLRVCGGFDTVASLPTQPPVLWWLSLSKPPCVWVGGGFDRLNYRVGACSGWLSSGG